MNKDFPGNHAQFELDQKVQAEAAYQNLGDHSKSYLESYARLSTLQAWNAYIFAGTMPQKVFNFFIEAQNDALISHLLARQGMWRPSLQSLRSCLENVLVCHYYLDHLVELRLWERGEHKIGFSELKTYFEMHPDFKKITDSNLIGLVQLKAEYSELSKSVHGSSFFMGDNDNMPNVYIPDMAKLGQWTTRHKNTIKALNLFMLTFHREKLLGTAYPAMRKSLAGIFSTKTISQIKTEYKVTLRT